MVKREAPSSDTIIGNAIKIIFVSSAAIRVPSVVFPNAIHLYEILILFLLLDEGSKSTNQKSLGNKYFYIYIISIR
jgi:hypothetical protein